MTSSNKIRKYGGWKYQIVETEEKNTFSITPNIHIPFPNFLYKYYSLNDYSLDCLENSKFYASEPFDFNDIFDTSIHLIDFNLSDSEYRVWLSAENPEIGKNTVLSNSQRELANEKIKNFLFQIFFKECGILCFSGTIDNEILWGYYNNNKGYCLELTEYKNFGNEYSNLFPINYVEKIEKIVFQEVVDAIGMLILTNVKKKIWSIENEFRMLVRSNQNGFNFKDRLPKTWEKTDNFKTNRFSKYPLKCINRIILGHMFLELENAENTDNYTIVELISKEKAFKKKLFDFILEKEKTVAMIHQEINQLSIIPINYKLEKIATYKYKMTAL